MLDVRGSDHAARPATTQAIKVGIHLCGQFACQRRGLAALRTVCGYSARLCCRYGLCRRGGNRRGSGRLRFSFGCCWLPRVFGFALLHVIRRINQVGNRMRDRHHGVNRCNGSGQKTVTKHFHVHDRLVGFYRGNDVTTPDFIADALFPTDNDAFRHGVGKLGHFYDIGFRHRISIYHLQWPAQ